MSEWKEFKLKEIAEFNPETLTVKNNWKEINYLDTGNITRGVIDTLQFLSSDGDNIPSRAKRIVRSNDIVYSTVRPNQEHYGLIKVPAHNMIVSTGFTVIRAKNAKCDSGFLYYFMTLPDNTEYLSNVAEDSTTAYPSIKPDVIMDMDILLPLIPEQKAIAEILSSLDDKIDLLNRQNKTLEDLAETYFRQWFIEEADEYWKVGRLEDVASIQNGYSFSSKDYVGYDYNTLEVFKMGHISPDGGLRVQPKTDFVHRVEKLKKWTLNQEDIVMAMTDMKDNVVILAVPALIDKSDKYVLNQRVARITLKNDLLVDVLLLYYQLKNKDFIAELQSKANSGVQVNLTTESIKRSNITIPKKNVQQSMIEIIRPIYNKIHANSTQAKTLQKLRDTLLPKLISGEVKVKM